MLMNIDDRQIDQLERDLKRFAKTAYPFATLETLNEAVKHARIEIRANLRNKMTLRNKWTAGSIQIRKARGLKVESQAAEVGSMQDYMREQEEGFTRTAKGKHGVPVPMPYAAGQGNARQRTKTVRAAHRLARIQFGTHRALGVNRKQRNVRSVQEAVKTGKRYVFMQFKQKKGIYKVIGGTKKVKRGWPKGARLRLVWSLTNRTYNVKAHVWMKSEVDRTREIVPELYRKALTNQLKRLKVLQYNGKINR